MKKVKVSVCIITYNQEKYIHDCLKGVLSQKTNFDIEIIIGDDCSSDKTRTICKSIQDKYPELIKLIARKKNLGMAENWAQTIKSCNGKYIALCEGDDYWTDELKLQKQIDFLELNSDYNICFTRANTLKNNKFELHPIPDTANNGSYYYIDLLKHNNFITTASAVIRNKIDYFPEWFFNLKIVDIALYFLVSKTAKIKCLEDITTVYRVHDKGVWSGVDQLKKVEMRLFFYKSIFNELTSEQKQAVILKRNSLIKNTCYQIHKNNRLLRVLKRIWLRLKFNF